MGRNVITIRGGKVVIPDNVQMYDYEIAQLFGVFASKVKANIRSLLKSRIVVNDCSAGGVVYGKSIYPQCYDLEMVVALSFRIDSTNARIFRDFIVQRVASNRVEQTIFISLPQSQIFN